jgi:hypothetical protein
VVGPVRLKLFEFVAVDYDDDGCILGIVGIVLGDGGIGIGDPLVDGLRGAVDDDGGLRVGSVAINDCLADLK